MSTSVWVSSTGEPVSAAQPPAASASANADVGLPSTPPDRARIAVVASGAAVCATSIAVSMRVGPSSRSTVSPAPSSCCATAGAIAMSPPSNSARDAPSRAISSMTLPGTGPADGTSRSGDPPCRAPDASESAKRSSRPMSTVSTLPSPKVTALSSSATSIVGVSDALRPTATVSSGNSVTALCARRPRLHARHKDDAEHQDRPHLHGSLPAVAPDPAHPRLYTVSTRGCEHQRKEPHADAGRGRCAGPPERAAPEQRRCRTRPGRRVAHRPRDHRLRNGLPRERPSRVGPARCGRLLDAS